ncbi:TIGR01621 family pseudouridine synthase, partial [Oceanospirillum sp. HFRX-1_2]
VLVEHNEDYVIIAKAPGVDVHRDGDEAGISEKVSVALGLEKLYLVHRLDKVTSGLMVLAKNADSCAQLAALFKARKVSKFYLAVSAKKPKKKQGWIIGDMERSRRGSWKLTSGKTNPAVTQFFSKPLQAGFRAFLLKPSTGKTHQLRVALKSIGAPICGDLLYDDAG